MPKLATNAGLQLHHAGHPLSFAAQEVPAEVPEPAIGINFARDGMQRKDWLGLVAVHSDAWLMALAFYKGARLDKEERCAVGSPARLQVATPGSACPESAPKLEARWQCLTIYPSTLCREELFTYINKVPTVYEVVSGRVKPTQPGQSAAQNKKPSEARAKVRTAHASQLQVACYAHMCCA